jgi:hypothetical protein
MVPPTAGSAGVFAVGRRLGRSGRYRILGRGAAVGQALAVDAKVDIAAAVHAPHAAGLKARTEIE